MTILNSKGFLCSNHSKFVPWGTHWKIGMAVADSGGLTQPWDELQYVTEICIVLIIHSYCFKLVFISLLQ